MSLNNHAESSSDGPRNYSQGSIGEGKYIDDEVAQTKEKNQKRVSSTDLHQAKIDRLEFSN